MRIGTRIPARPPCWRTGTAARRAAARGTKTASWPSLVSTGEPRSSRENFFFLIPVGRLLTQPHPRHPQDLGDQPVRRVRRARGRARRRLLRGGHPAPDCCAHAAGAAAYHARAGSRALQRCVQGGDSSPPYSLLLHPPGTAPPPYSPPPARAGSC